MSASHGIRLSLGVALVAGAMACAKGDAGRADDTLEADLRSAGGGAQQAGLPSAGSGGGSAGGSVRTPVQTAARPANACGWISAADVAAVVGPLSGTPTVVRGLDDPTPAANGKACKYPVSLPDSVLAATRELDQKAQEMERRLAKMGATLPSSPREPEDVALLVEVRVPADVIGERTAGATSDVMRDWAQRSGMAGDQPSRATPRKSPEGWDHVGGLLPGHSAFNGRVGQVEVAVTSLARRYPKEKTAALAARVRDRVADLPFAAPSNDGVRQPALASWDAKRDPCAFLSRADAEAVLGPLVVAPYRSSTRSPLADGAGNSCAYYSAGHHVVVITPQWEGGKESIKLERGIGDITGIAVRDRAAQAADTLEGPWDDVAANGHEGEHFFLKGDRLLEISHGMSAADASGVMKLARAALARF